MVIKKVSNDLKDLEAEGCYVEVAKALAKASRCMFVTGAGISCSAGIPDFRSKAGLYNLLKSNNGTVVRGQDLFDANLFRSPETTGIFYRFMGEFKDMIGNCKYTKTHSFIKRIHDSDKLLRCYTQNIDDLEVGLTLSTDLEPNPRQAQVVQLHGTMSRVVCTRHPTQHFYEFSSEYVEGFKNGEAPDCPACVDLQQKRAELGKRTNGSGTLRPDIVLYNEPHPMGEVIGKLQCHDLRKKPDFLLIMGTSLKIPGCKRLVKEAAKIVHSYKHGKVIFVNLTEVSHSEWNGVIDYHFQCLTDAWVDKVDKLFLKFYKPKIAPRTLPRSASATLPRKPDLIDTMSFSSSLSSCSSQSLASEQKPFQDNESDQSPHLHSLATPTLARSALPRSSSAFPTLSFGRTFESKVIRSIDDFGFDSSSTKVSDYSTDEDLFPKAEPEQTKPIEKGKRIPIKIILDQPTPFQLRKKCRGMIKANKAELASGITKGLKKQPSLGKRLILPKPVSVSSKELPEASKRSKTTHPTNEIGSSPAQRTRSKLVQGKLIDNKPNAKLHAASACYSLRPRKKAEENSTPKVSNPRHT
ncbi:NAD-dependent deacetylase hst3 [Massospora cicadina]|nr:NAD-dependent deacetylase hst3 [Massospora cicadina]